VSGIATESGGVPAVPLAIVVEREHARDIEGQARFGTHKIRYVVFI
jgi:hypothetical protein